MVLKLLNNYFSCHCDVTGYNQNYCAKKAAIEIWLNNKQSNVETQSIFFAFPNKSMHNGRDDSLTDDAKT